MPFEMSRKTLDSGIEVITLIGTLTMGSQLQGLEWEVDAAVKAGQKRIVLDVSQVGYVDSAAIGVLVACSGVAKNAGGDFRIAGVTDRVKTIMKLTRVDAVLHLDATMEGAVAAMEPGAGAA